MCAQAGGGSTLQGSWAVSGVTVAGGPGDHQVTALSPGKMVIAGGPHPGADIPHPFLEKGTQAAVAYVFVQVSINLSHHR